MPSPRHCFCILLVLLTALLFRIPRIGEALPFFYEEDEGHHFNRVVEMVKSGDFNPHYFRKPSLHFYLRVPATAFGFLWEVKAERAKEIKEVRTRDPFGLAGYSFVASHPGIVKWNRLLSVLLSLGCVLLIYLIGMRLGYGPLENTLAGLLVALAPGAIEYSATIGVDGPMAFFCLLTSYLGIRLIQNFSLCGLWVLGLVSGLACSSKYNALPIVAVPFLAWLLLARTSIPAFAAAVAGPALGFLLGSPYLLAEFPLFLDHFAYEIWHYRVAGHVGHEATPGLAQLWHYLRWFSVEGLGLVPMLAALVGLAALAREWRREQFVFLSFPLLYMFLMCAQKANFERNMLVMFPYLALAAGTLWGHFYRWRRFPVLGSWLLILALLAQPLMKASADAIQVSAIHDSRQDLDQWLLDAQVSSVALAGQLQLQPWIFRRPGAQRIDLNTLDVPALLASGVERVVVPAYANLAAFEPNYALETRLEGVALKQRIVQNPEILVFKRKNLPL